MTKDIIFSKTNETLSNVLKIIILKEGTGEGVPLEWGLFVTSGIVNLFPKNNRVKAQVFLMTLDQVSKNGVQRPLSTKKKHNC